MPKTKHSKTTTRSNGKATAAATIRHLRGRIQELEQQVVKYRTALIKHLPEPPERLRLTRKQMKEMEEYRPTFSEFVDQFEARVKAGG